MARPRTRRSFITLAAGGVATLGLATACVPRLAAPSATPQAAAQPNVKRGGALVIGLARGFVNTSPYPGPQFMFGWGGLFNPLVDLDSAASPRPVSPNRGPSRTIARRSPSRCARASSSTRVARSPPRRRKWNLEYVKDPKNQAAAGAELKNVDVQAADARTLQLKLPDLMPHIFSLLGGVLMVDPQSDVVVAAAGTGPFKLDGLEPNNELRLARNEQYWQNDRPHLDAITYRTLPDLAAASIALETGAAHVVQVAASDVPRLRATSQVDVVVFPGSGSYDFAINTVDPPFDDKRVRQAIDLALDRQRFADKVMFGLTEPTHTIWMKTSPAWDASIDVGEFNLDKARQLLSDAGHGGGFETRIQGNNSLPEMLTFDQIVQADLEKIGIHASIEQLEVAQSGTLFTQAKFPALINHAYAYGDQDPAMQFTAFALRPEGNASRLKSREFVRLVDAARREPDFTRRMAIYRDVSRVVKDEAFLLPIANTLYPWGVRSNVQGMARQPLQGFPRLEDLSLG